MAASHSSGEEWALTISPVSIRNFSKLAVKNGLETDKYVHIYTMQNYIVEPKTN
jgi:hypothetical protein